MLPSSHFIDSLLARMSLEQKLGQMSQIMGNEGHISDELSEQVRAGLIGSIINEVNTDIINELQRIALEESELGIPLLIGRDVIHGFKTIFPIPLGQAASFSPRLIEQAARVSAIEASKFGINWTFSPMIDVSRDPRWGRIAESFGEDPYLCSVLGQAMIRGYQGADLSAPDAIAACAKHFAGYGASESGRDYATTNISEHELRNVYLRPFYAAHEADVATFMTSFGDLNGVPATGNKWLLKAVLRDEWQYKGMVVSDWESVSQLSIHGFTENDAQSASASINAGIDMEMSSATFKHHTPGLLQNNSVDIASIDNAVRRILALKLNLDLFSNPYRPAPNENDIVTPEHRMLAQQLASESLVLLENRKQCLPLNKSTISKLAVIGPLANDGYEQLGTWIFDGEERHSITCLQALQDYLPNDIEISTARGVSSTRSQDSSLLEEAVMTAQNADVALLFLGEESILSGEAHSRANIELPGLQNELVQAIAKTGTPIVAVVMAGRPIIVESIVEHVSALIFAWHPGTMGGPAIVNLLFGETVPSGRLPVSVPRHVGQVPLYYAQKNGGKPVSRSSYVHMKDIPLRASQTSVGMVSAHLDVDFTPRYPFGFGLNYSQIQYSDLAVDKQVIDEHASLQISVCIENIGQVDALETVQLYVRDRVGSVTRPVRELIAFKKVHLKAHSKTQVALEISALDLTFYDIDMQHTAEAGDFDLWVGADSNASLHAQFSLAYS
jgi:beta-glucosidase